MPHFHFPFSRLPCGKLEMGCRMQRKCEVKHGLFVCFLCPFPSLSNKVVEVLSKTVLIEEASVFMIEIIEVKLRL